jgi:anti-anti-sigma factor
VRRPPNRGRDGVPGLAIRCTSAGDTARITLAGEVDAATSRALAESLAEAIDAGCRRLECDVAAVSFIDASGIDSLLTAHRRVRPTGGALVLIGPSHHFRRLLVITGLDLTLEIRKD